MPLPINLPVGVVVVYGMGTTVSASGVSNISETDPTRYGYIYQTYSGGSVFVYDGDSVMFNNDNVLGRVIYNEYPYTMIPARLVTKENPPL